MIKCDENSFITYKTIERAGGDRYLKIVAHNKSSQAVEKVTVGYKIVDKGIITLKSTENSYNILPDEKMQIFSRELIWSKIEIDYITVQVADGSHFKLPPLTSSETQTQTPVYC